MLKKASPCLPTKIPSDSLKFNFQNGQPKVFQRGIISSNSLLLFGLIACRVHTKLQSLSSWQMANETHLVASKKEQTYYILIKKDATFKWNIHLNEKGKKPEIWDRQVERKWRVKQRCYDRHDRLKQESIFIDMILEGNQKLRCIDLDFCSCEWKRGKAWKICN